MNLHDPVRPKLNYRPAYLARNGQPVAPMPNPSLVFESDRPHKVYLAFWLLTAPNQATQLGLWVNRKSLMDILASWEADPEAWFTAWLNYIPNPTKTAPSLEDLGL